MNRLNNICYVADKADWLGARLPGTDHPLVAISRHSSGTPLQFFVKTSGRKSSLTAVTPQRTFSKVHQMTD